MSVVYNHNWRVGDKCLHRFKVKTVAIVNNGRVVDVLDRDGFHTSYSAGLNNEIFPCDSALENYSIKFEKLYESLHEKFKYLCKTRFSYIVNELNRFWVELCNDTNTEDRESKFYECEKFINDILSRVEEAYVILNNKKFPILFV